LSLELAEVFLHYGVYGGDAIDEWENKEGWQQLIWKDVSKQFDFPINILKQPPNPKIKINVHLFNIAHIPKIYRSFLDKLSLFWEITYFTKSLTPLYLKELDLQKNIISEANLKTSLESPLDANSLVANFSSLQKPSTTWLLEKNVHENFISPKEITSLNQIQKDIFDLAPIRKLQLDSSLQIHEAASYLREIEILHENLITILNTGTIQVDDILVMSTDIARYFPYIQFVFENKQSPLGYAISGLSSLQTNLHLKCMETFFSLAESRFDRNLIEDLITSFPIAKKQKFGNEEISLFKEISDEMNIEWGFDEEMKKEILEIEDISERGSWKYAFEEILKSIAYSNSIDMSKLETLGNLIHFLENLFIDLRSLKKREETLSNWIIILDTLLTTYFIESEELSYVLRQIQTFSTLAQKIEVKFSFQSIHKVLKDVFMKKSFDRVFSTKPVIQFSSLEEGSGVSKKVICLLGLDEDSFPRKKTVRSLNELKGKEGVDPQVENSEKDRFHFLEAIVSSKEKLIISYTGLSATDGKPLAPSLCLGEIIHPFIENPVIKHPNFDFVSDSENKKHAFEEPIKDAEELNLNTTKKSEIIEIPIRHLTELTKHPIRYFCNRILGIYLEKDEDKESREFFLSYMDKAIEREMILKENEDEIFERLEKKNLLPTALFKESAKIELLEELREVHLGLKTFDLSKEDFFTIYYDSACKEPSMLSDTKFLHPAIEIRLEDDRIFRFVGKIQNVTKNGIYTHKESSIREIWKHLAEITILNYSTLGVKPHLLFGVDLATKTISYPMELLLEYYLEASIYPSTLLPDQIERLLKKKAYSTSSYFEDPYLTYLPFDTSRSWERYIQPFEILMDKNYL
jgi:exodeoxyribonuclease V gamma subunit